MQMVTLIQFTRSSKDKLNVFTHLTLVHFPSRFLIVYVCVCMCNTTIQLPACDDGGLGSTTYQSVSGFLMDSVSLGKIFLQYCIFHLPL